MVKPFRLLGFVARTLATMIGMCVGLVCILLVIDFVDPPPPCHRYEMYDDTLTGQLYRNHKGDFAAERIKEIRFYQLPARMLCPCAYDHE